MTNPRRKSLRAFRQEIEAIEASERESERQDGESEFDDEPAPQLPKVPIKRNADCTPEEIRQRVMDLLAQRWNKTSLEAESDDEEEDDGSAEENPVSQRPAAIETAAFQLTQTTFDEQYNHRTCHFQATIAGQGLQLSAPDHSRLKITLNHPVLGALTLIDYEPRDRSLEESCEPRGFQWKGSKAWLCPLSSATPRPGRATLAESIERLPMLLAQAERLASLDRAVLLDQMVDFLLVEECGGPWWYYQERWSTFDCSDEEEDGRDVRTTERWRTLRDIFADHGLPSLLVFADGSSLLTCIHRTSFKSDVFHVHVLRDPIGRLTHADVVCVYYGE